MPKNLTVEDVKPNNVSVTDSTIVYIDNRTVEAGQVMGLLLALTYPVAGTFSNAPRL